MSEENIEVDTFELSESSFNNLESDYSHTSGEVQPNSKRKRTAVVRYGSREEDENDDAIFLDITSGLNISINNEATTTEEMEPSNSNDSVIEMAETIIMSPGEKIIYEKLLDLSIEINLVQKSIVDLRRTNSN